MVFRMMDDGEVGVFEGLALFLKCQRQKLVAPELVHSTLKRALSVFGMVDEEAAVSVRDVPVVVTAFVVVIAGLLVGGIVRETLGAVVPRSISGPHS